MQFKNREKILKEQSKRWSKKFKENIDFRKRRYFRDTSRRKYNKKLFQCLNCGSKKDLQRHHPNYVDLFSVILCRKCHNKLHKNWKLIGYKPLGFL